MRTKWPVFGWKQFSFYIPTQILYLTRWKHHQHVWLFPQPTSPSLRKIHDTANQSPPRNHSKQSWQIDQPANQSFSILPHDPSQPIRTCAQLGYTTAFLRRVQGIWRDFRRYTSSSRVSKWELFSCFTAEVILEPDDCILVIILTDDNTKC
jgi:hypothetical protein